MIFIFSNRNVKENRWLGDNFNSNGSDNIRVAKYKPTPSEHLEFIPEVRNEKLPSIKVIEQLENSDKPCCIFIHGFNQSLTKNLKKCKEIESYGVNVIAFSWPSNPGPQKWWWKLKEYKAARQNARRSIIALERFFDKFNDHIENNGELKNIKSLVVHSLGNYLLQSFVSGIGYDKHLSFLKNIMLHQADVNSLGHEKWVDILATDSRVLVTINESDDVLDFSDIINPDRLGNTLGNLNSTKLQYFNFGRIKEARNKHRLWVSPTTRNKNAKELFKSTFQGKKVATDHFAFNRGRNHFNVR